MSKIGSTVTPVKKLDAATSVVAADLLIVSQSGIEKSATFTQVAALIEGGGADGLINITGSGPQLQWTDTDTTDNDVSASIAIQATATGTGAEDIDVTFSAQAAGALTAYLSYDASDLAVKVAEGAAAKLSFFGVTPVVRTAAYTQTFSTANRTAGALTAVTLTDNSGGEAADGTIAEIADIALSTSDTYTDAAVNTAVNALADDVGNAVTELSDQINKLIADVLDIKRVQVSLIDDQQAYGLTQ